MTNRSSIFDCSKTTIRREKLKLVIVRIMLIGVNLVVESENAEDT